MAALRIDNHIAQLEQIIGYSFTNKAFGAESLNMVAPDLLVWVEGNICTVIKNGNLAIVGDHILATVLSLMWDKARDAQGRTLSKGQWDNIRKMLENTNLAQLGRELGIDRCILRQSGTGQVSDRMVADTMEAVFGAVARDSGHDAIANVRAVLEHVGLHDHPLLTFPDMRDLGLVGAGKAQGFRWGKQKALQNV